MLGTIKKHLYEILCIAVLGVLLIFFGAYIQTDNGQKVLNHFLGTFPFVKFMVGKIREITGLSKGLPGITENSVLIDFTKLLVSTLIKAVLFWLGSLIFLRLPSYGTNQILGSRSMWIDETKAIMDGPWYKIKACLVGLFSVLLGAFLVNLIINPLSAIVNSFSDKLKGTVFSFLIFVIVYLICGLIFALVSGCSLGFSLIKTAIFNILPEALSIFVTNAFVINVYLFWKEYQWGYQTIISFLVLLIWCGLSQYLVKWIQKTVSGSVSGMFSGGGFLQGFYWMLATLDAILLFYVMCVNTVDASNALTQNLSQLPFIVQMRSGVSPLEYAFADPQACAMGLWGLLFVCMLMASLQLAEQRFSANIIADIVIWSLELGFFFAIVLCAFAFVSWVIGLGALWMQLVNLVGIILAVALLMFYPALLLQSACTALFAALGLTLLQMANLCMSGTTDVMVILFVEVGMIIVGYVIHLLRFLF